MKNRVKELRTRENLTQEKLAEKIGVRRETIVSIERGKYNPSLQLAFKISKYFDMLVEEIFLFEEKLE